MSGASRFRGAVRGVSLPTRSDDWRLAARTARLVLSIPAYLAFAVVAALLALTVFVLAQNLTIVSELVVGGSLPLKNRLGVLVELYPFVGTSFSGTAIDPLPGIAVLTLAALMGVNLAMVAYHVREHGLTVSGSGGGVAGVVLGTLGAGCAACGSAVLAGVLSLVGIGGLGFLPLDGLEFALLGLVAVLLSTFWLADGMRGGEINGCPVDVGRR
ncbi:hypothetical protein [Halomarina oriensis]|uniref:Uncharacterized protein n=1 Tax=Halomarina oriensis TaxID=671145 RepID=A0A6B0GII7_9EURY|nr:hypothetical protein [Halomarina oriensis]MWG34564.1 hypothetical protein [Halomarina oriensis]